MRRLGLIFTCTLTFSLVMYSALQTSCSTKKLASTGDDKIYKDEDSSAVTKAKEKKGSMPFDTSSAPFYDTK